MTKKKKFIFSHAIRYFIQKITLYFEKKISIIDIQTNRKSENMHNFPI